jgi:L-ribulose-5-phosphate 3-epimerase
MQGRLVPPTPDRFQCFPRERWAEEFPAAEAVPLEGIEWIYDQHGLGENPLEADNGLQCMRELSRRHKVAVRSLCADYFMDLPLLRVSEQLRRERLGRLDWLLGRCQLLGIERVVLPFVDASRIETTAEAILVVECLQKVVPKAESCNVELHLETALEPTAFAALLARVDHPLIKVNYDSGNSSGLGYAPREEFSAYGHRIGSVHIKDRVRGGGTVPLGRGSADFPALRECLRAINYGRDFVLQVARGVPGDEVNWSRHNRQFVLDWWEPERAIASPSGHQRFDSPSDHDSIRGRQP